MSDSTILAVAVAIRSAGVDFDVAVEAMRRIPPLTEEEARMFAPRLFRINHPILYRLQCLARFLGL